MQKIVIYALFVMIPVVANAQQAPSMEWPDFRARVLSRHPVARQADLYRDGARASLLRAKGGFDPKAYADLNGKNFKDKTYFQYGEAGIKWPLGLGLELKGNYNRASGTFLNPESTLPDAGQVAAGISWTLGQGLLIDERRFALRQGRIGLEQGDAERSLILNDLLL
jgi:outer membrane protein TolC